MLPVALHYDPIQSARPPADIVPIASAHRTGKEPQELLIIATLLFLQSAEKIMSIKPEREKKLKSAQLCVQRHTVQERPERKPRT